MIFPGQIMFLSHLRILKYKLWHLNYIIYFKLDDLKRCEWKTDLLYGCTTCFWFYEEERGEKRKSERSI